MRGNARLSAICSVFVLTLATLTRAGPVHRDSRTLNLSDNINAEEIVEVTTNATTVEGVCIFGSRKFVLGETVPSPKPCEDCVCTENGVQCTPVQCEVRPGCKALHRADHCCPLYQCECERNGITYSNGEKLIDPDNPCQVCYCQGGEIVCNQIACFRRDDCEPRYVPGRCCPEYDHCPPREKISNSIDKETSQKIEPQKYAEMTTSGYDNEEKITTDNAKQSSSNRKKGDDENKNEISDENSPSKPVVMSINDSQNSNRVIPTLNIKEVTGLNNAIRIKEILPVNNFDFSTTDPFKSPTIVREASYVENAKKTMQKENSPENVIVSDEKNDTETQNVEAYQTPAIIRIGNQFLSLIHGDLVPNNSTENTSVPVITVIGVEGLQRVIDDPEEIYDGKEMKDDEDQQNELKNEQNVNTIKFEGDNSTDDSLISKEFVEFNSTKKYPEISQSSSEDPEQILQDVVSELYETTTGAYYENYTEENKKDIVFTNDVKKMFVSELASTETDNSNEANVINEEFTTVEPSTVEKNVQIPEEEHQSIPIEHLPEHNPEYPPIPEDIMIFSMTEDSLESGSSEAEFSGASSIAAHESKNKEEVLVKMSATTTLASEPSTESSSENSEKILPEVFQLINRSNKTNSKNTNKTSLVPEEWLKNQEDSNKSNNMDVPPLNLNSDIPNNILLSPSYKDSKEEDDSKDYMFLNSNSIPTTSKPESYTTDESTDLNDDVDLKGEFRSPGEPLLIPEWERISTTESDDDFTTMNIASENDVTTENSNILLSANIKNDEGNDESIIDDFSNTEVPQEYFERIEKYVDSTTEDPITNLVISTEISSIPSVKSDFSNEPHLSIVKKGNLEGEREIVDSDLISSNLPTKKQKKTMGNILADLISLVGDVANIGDHEVELSTVHNSIDNEKFTPKIERQSTSNSLQKEITTANNVISTTTSSPLTTNLELSEYSSEDKNDDIASDNDKVEPTTKKMYIDKDSDGKKNWKSTDHLKKDIEIIPKVENKIKNKAPEKIIDHTMAPKVIEKLNGKNETQPIKPPKSNKTNDIKKISTTTTQKPITKSKVATEPSTTTTTTVKMPVTAAPKATKNTPKLTTTTTTTTTTTEVPSTITNPPVTNPPKKIRPTTIKTTTTQSSVISVDEDQKDDLIENESKTIVEKKKTEVGEDLGSNIEATTENSQPTVMKVSSKSEQDDDSEPQTEDKLTKRDANSQLTESSKNIDESLISILREFFEKQYRH